MLSTDNVRNKRTKKVRSDFFFYKKKIISLNCKIAQSTAILKSNDLLLDPDCSGTSFNDIPPITYVEVLSLLNHSVL